MGAYILKRLLLMIPTILGVMLLTFIIVQFVPGGPIEQIIAQLENPNESGSRLDGGGSENIGSDDAGSKYRGAQGLDPDRARDHRRDVAPPGRAGGARIAVHARRLGE